ncbi:MAG: TonB-dependent receptor [Chitinophagaceae bacterium]|nr:TonB-dependent receptor [Chitinophagaceae bacterium]
MKKKRDCCHIWIKCGAILYVVLFFHFASYSQTTVKVSGTVIDSSDAKPLSGVSILAEGTGRGTKTDALGNFTIDVSKGAVLVFSYLSYTPQRFVVGDQLKFNIALQPGKQDLDEVIVVSYGTQKKREVTGAISTVNAEKLADMPAMNIGQKLQGRMAGIQINQNTGEPGAGLSIRVRGQASINAGNSPLVVVDGFPTMSGLNAISPDEIESVTLLKDASASSLYGSRAANGVILVTTKQAKDGKKSIEFSTNIGLEVVGDRGKPDLMNPPEFAQFKKEFYEDMARYEGYTGGVPEQYQNPEQYGPNDGTNWFDVLLREALTQNYNLTLSSGVKDLKSTVNFNYNKQDGVMLNSYADRFTARANNIYNATDKLTFGMNIAVSHRSSNITPGLGNGRNIIQNAYLMDPTLKYKNDDGTYPVLFSSPGMFPNPNYYRVVTERVTPNRITTLQGNIFAQYEIIEGLKYKISANGDFGNMTQRTFQPSTSRGGLGSRPPLPPIGSYSTRAYRTWLLENSLTYTKSLADKHNFDVFLGYSAQKFTDENSNIDGSLFPDDNVQWVNAATTRIGTAGISQSALLSYIGRLNYNFDGKYLLSVAFRRDGSSKFGPDAKYGNFPSVSVGWVASDERFVQNIKPISWLKLRASYGKLGNENIGNYNFLAPVQASTYVFQDGAVSGKALTAIGNNGLTWETTTQFDIGLDLGLFNDRIFFTYDYYWKKTDGLLYAVDIPIQSGYTSIQSNIGQFNFWGHEFALETKNIVGRNFKWSTSFNISFNRNIVKKLGTNDAPIGAVGLYWDPNRTAVGRPMGQFYGYINDGVYMTQQEYETQPHGVTSMVGTARFKDISGPEGKPDNKIDAYDRTFIGDPNPDFVYGMINTLSYKAFDLNITMAGAVGGDITDEAFQSTENLDGVFNVRKEVAERWRSEENPGKGNIPRTRAGTTEDFRNFTTRQVFDATFLAVKNISLGYTVPVKSNNYLKGARIYVSLQNAFMFTKYPGMNPEASSNGLNGISQGRDFTAFPIAKVYSVGLNVNF